MKLITVKQRYQFRLKFPKNLSFDKVCIQRCGHANFQEMRNTETAVSSTKATRFVIIRYNAFFSLNFFLR